MSRALATILVIGIATRLAVFTTFVRPGGLVRQEPTMIAENINAGLGFVFPQYETMYYALKEPGHIALLALLMRWFGDRDLPILALQWACGVGVAVLVAVFTRKMTDSTAAALLAGILVAANPFLVYYDSLIVHSLSLDMLLFVTTTAVNVWAAEDPERRWRRAAVAGAVTGAALWQRSLMGFGGLAVWVVAVGLTRNARWKQCGRAAVWTAVALLVIMPWFARNHAVVGRWVLTTDFAHVLWLGNNPLSNGTYTDGVGTRVFYRAAPEFRAQVEGRPEVEQMDVFLGAVREFVRDHPAWAASLVARRILAFVWFAPAVGADYQPWQVGVYVVWYVVVLVLGAAGALRLWWAAGGTTRRRLALVGGAVIGIMALHALVAINMKHRVPLELVLSALAGSYVAGALGRARRDADGRRALVAKEARAD
jgi:4-amino-4-deoxy-L-arabinose transferase-like glycosyltransferase